MKIRPLEIKDAPFMLEWMHDESVTCDLKKDFSSMTLKDAESFIIGARESASTNIHMAIVSDADEYMGTVSLKNIIDGTAEFGIAIRKCAMGKGYSSFGMKTIIGEAFHTWNLESVYWCVDPSNARAVRFYDKNEMKGFLMMRYVHLFRMSTQRKRLQDISGI